jgi:predicted anti-sigma-YlaC factor YlaD
LPGDYEDVGCEQCRDALSAQLDGEDDPRQRAAVDAHLAGCADCRQWSDDAAAVTRLVRMSVVAPAPAINDTVLDAAPGPGRRRLVGGLRLALGVLGFAQFTLGMAQIGAYSAAEHVHSGSADVSSAHLRHESAAWNVALGAGFGWIAVRRSRPAGLVPLLTAFVGLLTLLSASDLWAGEVDTTRLLTHALVVLGYLIVIALSRPRFDFGDPPAQRRRTGWSIHTADISTTAPPRLRALAPRLPPHTARHDEAS